MLDKQAQGCSFFVSQAVYDLNASGTLLDDFAREAEARAVLPAPVLLTLSPCGSEKALQFMKWLGISFDPLIERQLLGAKDMLAESITICQRLIVEIAARQRGPVPLGINVESVSIRRVDIEAAVELAAFARRALAS